MSGSEAVELDAGLVAEIERMRQAGEVLLAERDEANRRLSAVAELADDAVFIGAIGQHMVNRDHLRAVLPDTMRLPGAIMTSSEGVPRPESWQAGDQVTRKGGRTTLTRAADGLWHWPNSDRTFSDWFINTWLDDGTVIICHLPPREEHAPCPTCRGPRRETTGMVCQTCGTDYAAVSQTLSLADELGMIALSVRAEVERVRATREREAFTRLGIDRERLALQRTDIAAALQEQARMRFDEFGPHDARGAAFWDAHVGILEGQLGLPVEVGGE